MSIYVEFIGLSGAGKTTLVAAVVECLEEQGVTVVSKDTFFDARKKRFAKLVWSFLHIGYFDVPTVRALIALARTQQLGFERTMVSLHEHLKLWVQLRRLSRYDVVLWDGVFVQRFVHLFLEGVWGRKETFDFIQQKLPAETLVVYVDVSRATATARRHIREPKLDRVSHEEQQKEHAFLMETQTALEDARTELAARNVPVVTLDGTRSPMENAHIIVDTIMARL